MKRTHYTAAAIMAAVVIAIIGYRQSFQELSSSAALGKEKFDKVTRKVAPESIKVSCDDITGSHVMLEMYPIKHSRDNSKNDFDIVMRYRNPGGKQLGDMDITPQEFKKKTGNFFAYMKSRKADIRSVPIAYEAFIARKKFCKLTQLETQYYPATMKLIVYSDSCRVPPGCTDGEEMAMSLTTATTTSDSCRVPPGCPIALLDGATVKDLLEREYAMKKTVTTKSAH